MHMSLDAGQLLEKHGKLFVKDDADGSKFHQSSTERLSLY